MLEDYWLHTFFDDPKAVTNTIEDDSFDPDNIAEELARLNRLREGVPNPNDFEDLP